MIFFGLEFLIGGLLIAAAAAAVTWLSIIAIEAIFEALDDWLGDLDRNQELALVDPAVDSHLQELVNKHKGAHKRIVVKVNNGKVVSSRVVASDRIDASLKGEPVLQVAVTR